MRSTAALVSALLLAGCSTTAPRTVSVVPSTPPAPPAPVPEILPDPGPVRATPTAPLPGLDTVRVGRFDGGKMWTFDAPPTAYFQEAYGFSPDAAWFERARLGALRFADYCSASFVSPSGLVMTNHHCARESVEQVSRAGEDLLGRGFVAQDARDERAVRDLFVDQLVAIRDVTDEATRGLSAPTPEQYADALDQRVEALQARLEAEARRTDPLAVVQVVRLYSGAKLSAYTFRRYKDVRLVVAPELAMGFFGGDPDNFTYPRYTLDFSFFRVYDDRGEPLRTPSYYRWNTGGVREGDLVFVVGNPGTTDRLASVAQLDYERDVTLPQQVAALQRRMDAIRAYMDGPATPAERAELRNLLFELSNAEKSFSGGLAGLRDPQLMARKAAAERALRDSIAARADLRERYARTLTDLAQTQVAKRSLDAQSAALQFFGSGYDSPLLARAFYAFYLDLARRGGVGPDQIQRIRKEALDFKYVPRALETELVRIRLEEAEQALGRAHPVVARLLGSKTAAEVAADLVARTTLTDSTRYRQVLDRGFAGSGDVMVDVTQALGGLFLATLQQQQGFSAAEDRLRADLNRARFAVYGNAVPPDASFSLRLADGRVQGYRYNGTTAPAYTTFFGMYDRAASNPGREDWALPERWATPPAGLDLRTPLNLVTTADITGGNSGSALLDRDLRVVGLVFDSNIEALPNDYLYRDAAGRSVAVDARAILAALDHVYDLDRLVLELTQGRFVRTEAEADRR